MSKLFKYIPNKKRKIPKLPDYQLEEGELEEAEEDMLDLAFGLTHTSRLGCQIILTKELDGMRIILPSATRNINL